MPKLERHQLGLLRAAHAGRVRLLLAARRAEGHGFGGFEKRHLAGHFEVSSLFFASFLAVRRRFVTRRVAAWRHARLGAVSSGRQCKAGAPKVVVLASKRPNMRNLGPIWAVLFFGECVESAFIHLFPLEQHLDFRHDACGVMSGGADFIYSRLYIRGAMLVVLVTSIAYLTQPSFIYSLPSLLGLL